MAVICLQRTYSLAVSALLAALGTALLCAGGLLPIMTYMAPLMASLCLIPVLLEFGPRWAWQCWIVTAVLSLLLCPDREAAVFYLFFGYYPLIRAKFERLRAKALKLLVKTLFFTLATALMFALLYFIFGIDLVEEELREAEAVWAMAFLVLLVLCMLLFDRVLGPVAQLYRVRLRPLLIKK